MRSLRQTFLVLAVVYFCFMLLGAFAYRVPPEGWAPAGWREDGTATPAAALRPNSLRSMTVGQACQTPQLWLLWLVLCLNVSAGIGVSGRASQIQQEIFRGRLLGENTSFEQLDAEQLGKVAAMAAGFTGLLSLFNILGPVLANY